ncbi:MULTISPECIES: YscQ/HrcQ family type III secretion apparatus protein [Yersinia]|uniref:YscQ/HrcQ family type III secretion apparatus protein n=1 Tax=Yersinia TaxID=629 RepID=UPI0005E6641F|nr:MULTISPECIES: YscQ/HrcQ family type III secretion apparatus protein [Yersinia]RXA94345.1 YscQ/HrcQ family type III secretion apparatus protein [Yersinia sp. 2105 StPb PI]CNI63673.1 type III secretion inner membrane protein [Yersinia frederiksenii]
MLGTLSAELRQISAVVGAGRHSAGISAAVKQIEGEGVYLPLHCIEQEQTARECGFWLSQTCWNHWLASSLATDDAHFLEPTLVTAMAHWAVSPLLSELPELAIYDPTPRSMTLLRQWAVMLTFELEGQQLSGVLFGWPLVSLTETLSHWGSELVTETTPLWQTGLVVGWHRLSLHQLQQIKPGDGMRITCAAELAQGNCWLWQTASPQIYIKLEEGNKMTIQQINDDIDKLLELDVAVTPKTSQTVMIESLPQTLVMEIGRLTLPLGDIKQLAVGQTLVCQTHFYGEVNIRLHGQPVGSGSLLNCEGELVVRIERWWTQ